MKGEPLNICACVGPQFNEPHCPCEMQSLDRPPSDERLDYQRWLESSEGIEWQRKEDVLLEGVTREMFGTYKHTTGDWRLEVDTTGGSNDGYPLRITAGETVIVPDEAFYSSSYDGPRPPKEEMLANARLISIAPIMHKLLVDLDGCGLLPAELQKRVSEVLALSR